MTTLRLAALLPACLAATAAHAVIITFDDLNQLANDFDRLGVTGGLAATAGIGLGGTNAVTAIDNAGSGGQYLTAGSLATASSFSVGIHFLWDNPTDANDRSAQLVVGVAGAPSLAPDPDGTDPLTAESVNYTTSRTSVAGYGNLYGFRAQLDKQDDDNPATTNFRLRIASVIDATTNGTFYGPGSYDITLTAGAWYFLELAAVYDSANLDYDLTANLYASSPLGVVGSLVTNGTLSATNVLNADVNSDPDALLAPFFGGNGNQDRSGIDALDNFTYIPEPSALALLATATLGATTLRRRRR